MQRPPRSVPAAEALDAVTTGGAAAVEAPANCAGPHLRALELRSASCGSVDDAAGCEDAAAAALLLLKPVSRPSNPPPSGNPANPRWHEERTL